jgi:hypothetical protein
MHDETIRGELIVRLKSSVDKNNSLKTMKMNQTIITLNLDKYSSKVANILLKSNPMPSPLRFLSILGALLFCRF